MLDGVVPRRALASTANLILLLKRADDRHFAVDRQGRWMNCQSAGAFVSPDIYTAHFEQVKARVLDEWCEGYTPVSGDVVVDVGAGIGEESLVFSKLVQGRGQVIAIEAHPGVFACLAQTIARSGLQNTLPFHCAIADRDGTLTISDEPEHLGNSVISGGGGIAVPARSLDSLADELGLEFIDFLKMNIEGAEVAAMKGMGSISHRIRNVAVECHDFVADSGGGENFRTRDFVAYALREMGFRVRERARVTAPWLRYRLYGRRDG